MIHVRFDSFSHKATGAGEALRTAYRTRVRAGFLPRGAVIAGDDFEEDGCRRISDEIAAAGAAQQVFDAGAAERAALPVFPLSWRPSLITRNSHLVDGGYTAP